MSFNDDIDRDVEKLFSGIYNKPCCRKSVGEFRSLSIGFGEKIFCRKNRNIEKFYGEWEVGTYRSEWRVIRNGRVLCGSRDFVDSNSELNDRLNAIRLGKITSPIICVDGNVKLSLDCGAAIEFFSVFSDDNDVFHILGCGSENVAVTYSLDNGWVSDSFRKA